MRNFFTGIWDWENFTGIWDWENFTGIWDYRYLCRGIQCKGRREARASLRRGGNVEGPESVLFPLGPCEKGLRGEWGEKHYRGRGELGGAVSTD